MLSHCEQFLMYYLHYEAFHSAMSIYQLHILLGYIVTLVAMC